MSDVKATEALFVLKNSEEGEEYSFVAQLSDGLTFRSIVEAINKDYAPKEPSFEGDAFTDAEGAVVSELFGASFMIRCINDAAGTGGTITFIGFAYRDWDRASGKPLGF